jgi:DNA-binding transcriptional LysR family regulator
MKFFDVKVFVFASELGNLSAVARELSVTPAAASAALKRLELDLDTRLIQRSTRSLTLTQTGHNFLPHARKALESLTQGKQSVQLNSLQGSMTLSVPSDFGRNILMEHLCEFQIQYPDIKLKVRLSDKYANFYSQTVDAALRYGEPNDSSLISLPLIRNNTRILCASPEYLALHGTPLKPEDLRQHNCLHFTGDDNLTDIWRFYQNKQVFSVKVTGKHLSDDGDYLRRLALKGAGIVYKTGFDVIQDIEAGRLIPLLPKFEKENSPLNMILPHRKSYDTNLNTLREYLLKALEQ